jgi:MtN3 and saliva related transmembrane protein
MSVRPAAISDLIGWLSSAILLLTIARQVFTQWRTRSTAGVSKWLFIGQFAASCGFATYSYLLNNWVFLSSNLALLAAAVLGQVLYVHNKRMTSKGASRADAS